MKCEDAREIINRLIDGEDHLNEDAAALHISGCSDCAKWQESLQTAIRSFETDTRRIAVPDLAYRIMALLPNAHPVSTRSQPSGWKPGRILGWTLGTWIFGAVLLCGLWLFMQVWFAGVDINQSASGAFTSVRAFVVSLYDLAAIPMALIRAVGAIFSSYIGFNIVIMALAVLFLFDTVVAAAAITIFKRKRVNGMLTI